jgi:hypothetical protein
MSSESCRLEWEGGVLAVVGSLRRASAAQPGCVGGACHRGEKSLWARARPHSPSCVWLGACRVVVVAQVLQLELALDEGEGREGRHEADVGRLMVGPSAPSRMRTWHALATLQARTGPVETSG